MSESACSADIYLSLHMRSDNFDDIFSNIINFEKYLKRDCSTLTGTTTFSDIFFKNLVLLRRNFQAYHTPVWLSTNGLTTLTISTQISPIFKIFEEGLFNLAGKIYFSEIFFKILLFCEEISRHVRFAVGKG